MFNMNRQGDRSISYGGERALEMPLLISSCLSTFLLHSVYLFKMVSLQPSQESDWQGTRMGVCT